MSSAPMPASYALYRALAVAAGQLASDHRPDLTDTMPAEPIGPFPQWSDHERIVSLDPWGHMTSQVFHDRIAAGCDIRPTIAVTRARINMPEIAQAIRAGRLTPDGTVLTETGDVQGDEDRHRAGLVSSRRRRPLRRQRHRPATRPVRAYRRHVPRTGDAARSECVSAADRWHVGLHHAATPRCSAAPADAIACRVHDECNGSDVFGSDICTCRPYLAHGVEVCVATAQQGGLGVVVYNRKEGRALGEVTKFLVYNARKRQVGGDRAEAYFQRTECVAGVSDMRVQELMPDVLHWLGITRIDQLVSMSNMKYAPIVASGIEVIERVPIPDELIPPDADVEIDAKKAAGYYTMRIPDAAELKLAKGRALRD